MKSSKLIMTMLVSISFIAFTFGQKKGKMSQHIEISEMKEELDLSEEQTHKLMEARTASQAKMKVLRADEKLTREEKRTVGKEIRKEHKKMVDDVLTDEQKAKSKEVMKKKRAEHRTAQNAKSKEMKAYREEFDSKISAQDKAELARLRKVLKKDKIKNRSEKPNKEERMAFKEAHETEFESLNILAEKYEGDIKSFLATKEIKDGHRKKAKSKRKVKAKKKGLKGKRKGKNGKAARFLLMDQEK